MGSAKNYNYHIFQFLARRALLAKTYEEVVNVTRVWGDIILGDLSKYGPYTSDSNIRKIVYLSTRKWMLKKIYKTKKVEAYLPLEPPENEYTTDDLASLMAHRSHSIILDMLRDRTYRDKDRANAKLALQAQKKNILLDDNNSKMMFDKSYDIEDKVFINEIFRLTETNDVEEATRKIQNDSEIKNKVHRYLREFEISFSSMWRALLPN